MDSLNNSSLNGVNNERVISKNIEDAINYIEQIKQEVYQMGANDHEIPSLDQLIFSIKNNQIDYNEAMTIATSIRDRKNDYH